MKRWMVETRATVLRTNFVDAENEKDAEAASCDAQPDLDEDENEETMTISEVPTTDEPHVQCPLCGGDCAGANPPVYDCPMTVSDTSQHQGGK